MGKIPYKWLTITALAVGWVLAWSFAWQAYLLEGFYREPSPGVTVFTDEEQDLRNLWIAAGAALGVAAAGVFLLVLASLFRRYSSAWYRIWLVAGAVFTLVGLSFPLLFPSAKSIVIDEPAGVVTVEKRWLYATIAEAVAFDEIARLNLRVHRTWIRGICQTGTGLSIIRRDGTWLDIPFEHEAVGHRVAEVAKLLLTDTGIRRC